MKRRARRCAFFCSFIIAEQTYAMHRFVILCFMIVAVASTRAVAQSQLVLLKGQRVILRMVPGDDFVFKRKGRPGVITTYINNLSDTAVVTHSDTIPFHQIERLYFVRTRFYNKIGYGLVVGGAGYFLIDQFNTVVVRGESFSLDDRVTRTSVGAVAVGIPLLLIKKKSQKIAFPYRLLEAREGSPFYIDMQPKGYTSPYIPR